MKWKILILCFVAFLIDSAATGSLLENDPFLAEDNGPVWSRGEEILLYEVSFIGIAAGYAELSYKGEEQDGEKKLFHIHARLWTTGFVKFFKEVNDEFDYFVDSDSLLPHKVLVSKKKSDRTEKKVVYYDQQKGLLEHFTLEGEKIKEFQAVPDVFEPTTVAYFLRTLRLPEDLRSYNVYGGRKLFSIEVEVIGNEKVKTDVGVFDTLKIRPVIKHKGEMVKNREITAWIINDGSNIPLLVHAKVKGFSLTGELIKMDRGRRGGR